MGKTSNIGWTDGTNNIAVGCTKVSDGCKYCYMMRDYERRKWDVNGTVTRTQPATFYAPLTWQSQGLKAADGRPYKVFSSSLTDVFHPAIDAYRKDFWNMVKACPDLRFQVLTKRIARWKKCLPKDWSAHNYPNVWLGVSVESQKYTYRMEMLAEVEAAVRFVSFEPLIGHITSLHSNSLSKLDWAIIGGESGNNTGKYRYRECEMQWIADLILLLGLRNVPIFIKQLGTHLAKELGLKHRHGADVTEFPKELQLQQFPNSYL